MASLNNYISEYKKLIINSDVRKAYRGLMEYIMKLRIHFKNKYPDYYVSGSIYFGYMDMTYFSFSPTSLKNKNLKIAIVFIHEKLRFEVWLAGNNKQIQKEYWKLFKESNWGKYRMPSSIEGVDSIIEHILVEEPNFDDLKTLTEKIEMGVLEFIEDIQNFLG